MTASPSPRTAFALDALEKLVREFMQAPASVEVVKETIKPRVIRLRCTVEGSTRSFVGKRLDPHIAHRNELVARRWLPAIGLADVGPPLLAVAADRDGSSAWHLYDDLGDSELDARNVDFDRVAFAVAAVARVHTRFAGHSLIPECRLWGGDLGIYFYVSSVRDAILALECVQRRGGALEAERATLCDRLLARLAVLLGEHMVRGQTLARYGGPETLLHGDLWPTNVMVASSDGKPCTRLIDWDHAAVGPVSYDISTFLSRFPAHHRAPILRMYAQEVRAAGWQLPSAAELNVMFQTAELARIANRVIWPAVAAYEDGANWAFDQLEEVERWFEQLAPLLPHEEACGQS
jgi:hypothetical protein